jgi:hypothetical protein
MINIDEPLHFGKYKGYSVREIYKGMNVVSQTFINDLLDYGYKDFTFLLEPAILNKPSIKVAIKNFEILINNNLQFNLSFDGKINNWHESYFEAAAYISWCLIFGNESKIAIDTFGSANEKILSINEIKKTKYRLSADPSYIEWCINNLDIFHVDFEDIIKLQNETCHYLNGINLYFSDHSGNYKYEVSIDKNKYTFAIETLEYLQNKLLR